MAGKESERGGEPREGRALRLGGELRVVGGEETGAVGAAAGQDSHALFVGAEGVEVAGAVVPSEDPLGDDVGRGRLDRGGEFGGDVIDEVLFKHWRGSWLGWCRSCSPTPTR